MLAVPACGGALRLVVITGTTMPARSGRAGGALARVRVPARRPEPGVLGCGGGALVAK